MASTITRVVGLAAVSAAVAAVGLTAGPASATTPDYNIERETVRVLSAPEQSVLRRFVDNQARARAGDVNVAACAYGALFSKGPSASARWTKVLDVRAWATANRSVIHLWSYRDAADDENQRWYMCNTGATWNGHPVATIENSHAAISILRLTGKTNIAAALRHNARDYTRPLQLLHINP